jgi:hypothetical protein
MRSHLLSANAPVLDLKPKAKAIAQTRDEFIAECFVRGGVPVVESVRKYGVNEKGEDIRLSPWFEEVLLLIGDFRISETWVTGCSQLGKTLAHTLTLCHYLTIGNLAAMWAYDMQASRDLQVRANFWPVIEGRDGVSGWIGKLGIKKKSGGAAQNINVYQVAGGEVQFPYVSTSKSGSGGAAAGGIAVGVSRDWLVKEERSQYAPGAGEVLNRRLDASRIPTKPIRNNGTPGGGLGIEAEIESEAEFHFMPHCICPECDRVQPLDFFGSLLKPEIRTLPNGESQNIYLSDSGRPVKWFHSDPNEPVKTAYFGCPACAGVLSNDARKAAWYQCIKTGIRLRDYLDQLPKDVPSDRQTAALEITPLLRIEKGNIAADIIREGLTTTNPADWCQQRGGKPSISRQSAIALDFIKQCIGAAYPDHKADLRIAGIDQARADGDHVWIQDVWFPEDWESMSVVQVKEQSIRRCLLYKAVPRDRMIELLEEYNVEFGMMDSEPDIPSASALSKSTVLEIADQRASGMKDQVERGVRESGGVKYKFWKIRNRDFLNDVLYNFTMAAPDGLPLMRLPEEWQKWTAMLKAETSPIRHLMSMKREPETRLWIRPEDTKDGAFYACMFAEAALTTWLTHDNARPFAKLSIPSISGDDAIAWMSR